MSSTTLDKAIQGLKDRLEDADKFAKTHQNEMEEYLAKAANSEKCRNRAEDDRLKIWELYSYLRIANLC